MIKLILVIFSLLPSVTFSNELFSAVLFNYTISSNMNMTGNLYPESKDQFRADLVSNYSLEIVSNKVRRDIEVSAEMFFANYENSDLKILNKSNGLVAKIKYFPLTESEFGKSLFMAFLGSPYIDSTYSIDSNRKVSLSSVGGGIAIGTDFYIKDIYLLNFSYSYLATKDKVLNSALDKLSIGVGFKWE